MRLACRWLMAGSSLGTTATPSEVTPNHGCSRTVPALVHGVHRVDRSPLSRCLLGRPKRANALADGHGQQFGTEERQWYTGQCPLVDGDRVILAPCGADAMLVAVEYRTGQILWKERRIPRLEDDPIRRIMTTSFAGRKMYV